MTLADTATARRAAVYSAWIYLAGPRRSPAAQAAWNRLESRFGGISGVLELWSQHEGVPADLAEVVSALIHAQPIASHLSPTARDHFDTACEALWLNSDLETALAEVRALAEVLNRSQASSFRPPSADTAF